MVEDLNQIISEKKIWHWDFQIYLNKIARVKIEPKKILFIPISAKLEIIPNSRISNFKIYEFSIKDDHTFYNLKNIIISIFGSSDYKYSK